MNEQKAIQIGLRTTAELKADLQVMAKAENRTVSNLINVILEKAIKEYKEELKNDNKKK